MWLVGMANPCSGTPGNLVTWEGMGPIVVVAHVFPLQDFVLHAKRKIFESLN
jgi:hypothetical protein